jgi:hypothetical protein
MLKETNIKFANVTRDVLGLFKVMWRMSVEKKMLLRAFLFVVAKGLPNVGAVQMGNFNCTKRRSRNYFFISQLRYLDLMIQY